MAPDDGKIEPVVLNLLLAGTDQRRRFPSASIFVGHQGNVATDPPEVEGEYGLRCSTRILKKKKNGTKIRLSNRLVEPADEENAIRTK